MTKCTCKQCTEPSEKEFECPNCKTYIRTHPQTDTDDLLCPVCGVLTKEISK